MRCPSIALITCFLTSSALAADIGLGPPLTVAPGGAVPLTVLLTNPAGLSWRNSAYLAAENGSLWAVDVLGGPNALPNSLLAQIATAAGAPGHPAVVGAAEPAGLPTAAVPLTQAAPSSNLARRGGGSPAGAKSAIAGS